MLREFTWILKMSANGNSANPEFMGSAFDLRWNISLSQKSATDHQSWNMNAKEWNSHGN
jgi:hypothetical protein